MFGASYYGGAIGSKWGSALLLCSWVQGSSGVLYGP